MPGPIVDRFGAPLASGDRLVLPARARPLASQVGGGMPRPKAVDQPYEVDYYWRRAAPRPVERTHFRDIPVLGSGRSFCEVEQVRAALDSLANGQFFEMGQLCDAYWGDDRISAILETRIDALSSFPIETAANETAKDSNLAKDIAQQVQREWPTWFSTPEVKRLHEWGLLLGFGIGELLWDTDRPNYWTPRLKTWDLRYCYWRWDTRSFWLITLDGQVEVRPGDGHWIVYAPHGYTRPWMHGLGRAAALPFMTRTWTSRDWARWCEVHGLPIKLAIVPWEADPAAREAFINDLCYIGNEAVLRAEQESGQEGRRYDLKLVEAASQSWQGFQRLLERCDDNLSIRFLGQTLTTQMGKSGSYAAANVHDRIRMDRVESDAQGLGQCLSEQGVKPWAIYNFPDGATLAPSTTWSTKPPEDRASTAKTLNDLGDALNKLRKAGLNVDLEKMATQFRLPLVDGKPIIPPTDAPSGSGARAT